MSSEKTINILMTGAGAPGAAGILKCLQFNPNFEIIMADANSNAVGRWLHAEFETIPFAHEKNFIQQLLSICQKRNIHVLLPLVTKELIPLAHHKKEFEELGTKVLVSNVDGLEIANNKGRLYQFLEWRGIKVPEYKVVETVDQFKIAVEELGFPAKRVCFKPSVSNGSRGFRIVANDIDEHDLLFNEKPSSTYISLNDAIRILSLKPFPELLVTEYLPAEEYSVDCIANHGETIMAVPRLRSKMLGGISIEGIFVKEETLMNYCSQIIKELQLHGNIGIQVKKSKEGKFLIIEINPRVQGTIVASLGAGVNLPTLAIKQELDLLINNEELQVKWGTKFSRYWNEVYH
ncbi:MAG TPA: ATP-grasp domain-containing protein [Chitinophagaceae bacterium]|jgi:carbamoyl-phosphate synthase large subunit|nr:ATP-grasp domain-containing protein [Chitinophagaceae bacterium]